jgi:hypothetical protein
VEENTGMMTDTKLVPLKVRVFHISEMTSENGFIETHNRWGRREYRQKKSFGNWHVIFVNSEKGVGHWDKYNATGSLEDKFNHLSMWVSEQLGISETMGKLIVVGISGLAASKVLKQLSQ